MEFGKDLSKTYRLGNTSVQNVAYALSEFLDTRKNMITQTMRTRNGYTVQCKGDANAEWTRYIGLDAAVTINLIPMSGDLIVEIGTGQWVEKLGIAAVGSILFSPHLITSGLGALRQITLPNEIFDFIGRYLGETPQETERSMGEEKKLCPVCGKENNAEAAFCARCGTKFEEPEEVPFTAAPTVCPSCGKQLNGDEAFCPSCGKKLGE